MRKRKKKSKDGKIHCCDICGEQFTLRWKLKAHVLWHEGKSKYSCKYCGQYFKNKNHLDDHVVRHLKIKRYQCPICLEKYTHEGTLHNHMYRFKVHGDIKKYKRNELIVPMPDNISEKDVVLELPTRNKKIGTGRKTTSRKCDSKLSDNIISDPKISDNTPLDESQILYNVPYQQNKGFVMAPFAEIAESAKEWLILNCNFDLNKTKSERTEIDLSPNTTRLRGLLAEGTDNYRHSDINASDLIAPTSSESILTQSGTACEAKATSCDARGTTCNARDTVCDARNSSCEAREVVCHTRSSTCETTGTIYDVGHIFLSNVDTAAENSFPMQSDGIAATTVPSAPAFKAHSAPVFLDESRDEYYTGLLNTSDASFTSLSQTGFDGKSESDIKDMSMTLDNSFVI